MRKHTLKRSSHSRSNDTLVWVVVGFFIFYLLFVSAFGAITGY